ncbi:MAG: NmrA family NAD(P)-binding protein [Cyanobacteria bacterium]|nr:NmrA family NAD(P)-binding protein [Cyanobacteriota bacterium]
MAAGGKPHPMISVDDIAWFSDYVLENQAEWRGKTLKIIAESLTIKEIASIYERVTGEPAEGRDLPLDAIEAIPGIGHDLANMHRFFQSGGVQRNVELLRSIHPGLKTFESWLQTSGWRPSRIPAKLA